MTVQLFVYGSLRSGQPLYDWVEGEVEYIWPGTIPGNLHHLPGQSGPESPFPIADLDGDGRIVGEVFLLPMSDLFIRLCVMELNAGYTLRSTRATVTGQMSTVPVSVFHWPHRLGLQIPSGDWLNQRIKEVI